MPKDQVPVGVILKQFLICTYLQDTLPFPDRPSPDRLKTCRTVSKMVYNSLKQAPSDIKSAFFLPNAFSFRHKRSIYAA